jgi:hypothetical protein
VLFADQSGLCLADGKRARTWIYRNRHPGDSIAPARSGDRSTTSHHEAIADYEESNRRRDRGEDPAAARDRAKAQRVRDESAKRARAHLISYMVAHYLDEGLFRSHGEFFIPDTSVTL